MFTRSDKEYKEMTQKDIEKAGAKIAYKDKSKLLKFLNVFIRIFNKRFMTEYVNVIGSTVWFPKEADFKNVDKKWLYCFMKHELHHVTSTKKKTIPGMILYYGFPQSLFILFVPAAIVCGIILGFCSIPVCILAGLAILSLIPWPAPFRVDEEVAAEVDSELARIEEGVKSGKENLFNNVCSFEYYNPMYKKEWARKKFERLLDKKLE